MRPLTARVLTALWVGSVLASNAVAQEGPNRPSAVAAPAGSPALPVAEAKKRYLESQKQLDDLAKGDVKLTRHETDLEIALVQTSRDRLRAAVAEAYDARRQLQQSELAELERRLANIKRALAISDAMKETIIDQRTDELLDQIEQGDEIGKREGASRTYSGATDGAVAPPPGSGSPQASALEIIDAQIDVQAAEANLAAAKRAHDYSKKMHSKGFVTGLDAESKASSYERAKLELERARLKLKSLGGTLPEDERLGFNALRDNMARHAEKNKRLAELDVEEAEADFAAAERDYLRVSAAHESGTITQEAFDKAENKCRHAKIELERARLKLEAFGGTSSADVRDTDPAPADGAATGEEPRIMWGQPVGWMQLGWHVEPRKDDYHLGDVLTFGLIIRNADKNPVQWTFPRTQVLEKLGFDLTLRDAEAVELRHYWGPAHVGKDKVLEVSGYNAASFEPGGTHELAVIKLLVGRGKTPGSAGHDPSIFAELDVTPGQTAQLWFNLSPREEPSGDEVRLQSVPFMFRVEPRR